MSGTLSARVRQFAAGVTPYFCLLLAVVTLGPHQFGFHLAELNAPQDVITCRKQGIRQGMAARSEHGVHSLRALLASNLSHCIPMSEAAFATASSVFTVGGLVGALAAGPLCSSYGRLPAMRSTAAVFLLGSTLEALATTLPALAVGRVLNGVGAGASTVIVPLYISEVAPAASRGFFGYFTQITVNVGILFTQTLGYFLSHGSAWRMILGTGIVLAVVQFVGLTAVPESPAWLVANGGDVALARRTLQKIRGRRANLDDEIVDWPAGARAAVSASEAAASPAEEQALLDQHHHHHHHHLHPEGQQQALPPRLADDDAIVTAAPPSLRSPSPKGPRPPVGFFQMVREPFYQPVIIAVIGVMFAQQLCGINSVIMYSVSLLDGMLPLNSALLTIVISAMNLVTTILCAPLPDRLGRKTCLVVSCVGQGLSACALAVSVLTKCKVVSALAVLAFVGFFAVGLGPVPFLLSAELVGQEAVGATQSWALGANYVATFLVAQFFPLINTALNARFGGAGWVFLLFSLFAVASAVFIGFMVPETKGKKDADEVWGRTTRLD